MCGSMGEVFSRYMKPGKPGYVAQQWVPMQAAIDSIHAAGGRAVLAHPARYETQFLGGPSTLLKCFADAGGDGVEVVCASHNPLNGHNTRLSLVASTCWPRSAAIFIHRWKVASNSATCLACPLTLSLSGTIGRKRNAFMPNRRTVFFVSDRTGITAEALGNSLLTQFDGFEFKKNTIPFVDSDEAVDRVVTQINDSRAADGKRPIVISSIVNERLSARMRAADACVLDFFKFLSPHLRLNWAQKLARSGRSHGLRNPGEYFTRIDAINFTLAHDDGQTTKELDRAQVI